MKEQQNTQSHTPPSIATVWPTADKVMITDCYSCIKQFIITL